MTPSTSLSGQGKLRFTYMKSSAKQESGIGQVTTVGTNHSEVEGLITPQVLPLARLDGSITENWGTSGQQVKVTQQKRPLPTAK